MYGLIRYRVWLSLTHAATAVERGFCIVRVPSDYFYLAIVEAAMAAAGAPHLRRGQRHTHSIPLTESQTISEASKFFGQKSRVPKISILLCGFESHPRLRSSGVPGSQVALP